MSFHDVTAAALSYALQSGFLLLVGVLDLHHIGSQPGQQLGGERQRGHLLGAMSNFRDRTLVLKNLDLVLSDEFEIFDPGGKDNLALAEHGADGHCRVSKTRTYPSPRCTNRSNLCSGSTTTRAAGASKPSTHGGYGPRGAKAVRAYSISTATCSRKR